MIVITKKEIESYAEILEEALKTSMNEKEIRETKQSFMKQLKEGFKEGAISIGINRKGNLVYKIDERFVTKVFTLYAKYLAVVIPQVMSIYQLTKNLVEDIAEQICSEEKK